VQLNDAPEGVYRRRFRRTYKKVRGRLRLVHRSNSAEALHDLRKSSKRLLNQARLLRSRGGKDFTEFRRRLVALDNLLGRSRDCGLLGEILRGIPAAEAPLRHGFGLRARLEQASCEARLESLRCARDLYGRTSREFLRRMLG
jgi:CHAD domain-containing protein